MGFGPFPVGLVRAVVGVLGIIYLVAGVLGFVVPSVFGLIPHGYTVFDNLLHLALRIISITLRFFGGARAEGGLGAGGRVRVPTL